MATSRTLGGLAMSGNSTFRLTFHVQHPTVPASEIEDVFRLPTRFSQSVGDQRKTKSGRVLEGIYAYTSVSFCLHDHPLPADKLSIGGLIKNNLTNFDHDYIHEIIRTNGSCNFLLGLFSNENLMFELDSEVINMLSYYQVSIKFDFYGGND